MRVTGSRQHTNASPELATSLAHAEDALAALVAELELTSSLTPQPRLQALLTRATSLICERSTAQESRAASRIHSARNSRLSVRRAASFGQDAEAIAAMAAAAAAVAESDPPEMTEYAPEYAVASHEAVLPHGACRRASPAAPPAGRAVPFIGSAQRGGSSGSGCYRAGSGYGEGSGCADECGYADVSSYRGESDGGRPELGGALSPHGMALPAPPSEMRPTTAGRLRQKHTAALGNRLQQRRPSCFRATSDAASSVSEEEGETIIAHGAPGVPNLPCACPLPRTPARAPR